MKKTSLCVYCGSRFGQGENYKKLAQEWGQLMVSEQMDLVYGGGKVGLMGEVASAVMKGGGKVIGIIPEGLFNQEVADKGITDLRVVKTMHERKALMEKLADGFVALPGGWGTLDELFEILTWAQLGIHQKPIGILNAHGFFDPLLQQMESMREQGFVSSENQKLFFVADNALALMEKIKASLHS